MDCKNFDEYASPYMDSMLSEQEKIEFEAHLENCEECRMKFKNLQLIVESINETEEIELPDNFTASLHEKLVVAEKKKVKKPIYWKPLTAVAAGLAVLIVSAAMISNLDGFQQFNSSSDNAKEESGYYGDSTGNGSAAPQAAEEPQITSFDLEGGVENHTAIIDGNDQLELEFSSELTLEKEASQRKLIETGNINLETEAFDESYQQILDLVNERGGYVQTSESYYHLMNRENPDQSLKSAYMVIRVPSTDFKPVFEHLKGLGLVVNEQINTQDVTLNYRDLENELTNLQVQEERLREILQQAEMVEDVLKIENELNRVRTQINSIQGSLQNLDQLISLGTIEIHLSEVETNNISIKSTNDGIWGKAVNSLIDRINQMIYLAELLFINFFGVIPLLAVLMVIGIPTGIWVRKKIIMRRK